MIVGVVGPIGAGKDTIADYLAKKYKFYVVSYRDIVKEAVEKEGLEPDRHNMQKVSRMYRDKYGEDVFANMVLEKAKRMKGNVLLKEMRTVADINIPKKHFGSGLVVIAVDAKSKLRFERLKKRGRIGDPKDFKEFMRNEETEKNFGYYEGMKLADFTVRNDGSVEELYKKLDKIMEKI
jgi:dephospho-CoA kinase